MSEFFVSTKKEGSEEREEKKKSKALNSSNNLRSKLVELEQELLNKDTLIEKISLLVGKLTVELELKKIEKH
jgi:hypothetical protein